MTVPDASQARERRRAVFRLPKPGNTDKEAWRQLVRFCVVGASGVVVNLIVFSLLLKKTGLHHTLDATIAFVVAWSTNFVLNKHWTFQNHDRSVLQQGMRNLVVSVIALALNLIILDVLVRAGTGKILAQLIAIAIVTPVNFLFNRRWSFR